MTNETIPDVDFERAGKVTISSYNFGIIAAHSSKYSE
jgi:hypothetical protein